MPKEAKSSATEAEKHVHGTIYDDAFRTMAEKTPELIVMLVNEMFGTHYDPFSDTYYQPRNEHMALKRKVVTDSVFVIQNVPYHIEVQIQNDTEMVIRMIEYDFMIALENAEKQKNGVYRVEFPKSCVLYIANARKKKETIDIEVVFPDGQKVIHKVKAVPTLRYTIDDIFEKELYALIPFYLLKYSGKRDTIEASEKEREKLFREYSGIVERLNEVLEANSNYSFVAVVMDLVRTIAEELLNEQPETKKGLGEIMGGQVLSLPSDRIREEGKSIGFAQAIKAFFESGMSIEEISSRLGISLSDVKKACAG